MESYLKIFKKIGKKKQKTKRKTNTSLEINENLVEIIRVSKNLKEPHPSNLSSKVTGLAYQTDDCVQQSVFGVYLPNTKPILVNLCLF